MLSILTRLIIFNGLNITYRLNRFNSLNIPNRRNRLSRLKRMEFHLNWNVTETGMSLELEFH